MKVHMLLAALLLTSAAVVGVVFVGWRSRSWLRANAAGKYEVRYDTALKQVSFHTDLVGIDRMRVLMAVLDRLLWRAGADYVTLYVGVCPLGFPFFQPSDRQVLLAYLSSTEWVVVPQVEANNAQFAFEGVIVSGLFGAQMSTSGDMTVDWTRIAGEAAAALFAEEFVKLGDPRGAAWNFGYLLLASQLNYYREFGFPRSHGMARATRYAFQEANETFETGIQRFLDAMPAAKPEADVDG